MQNVKDLLKNIYLFQNFTDSELDKLAEIANKVVFNGGDTIFYEGSEAKSFFVLEYGSVKIMKKASEDSTLISTLGPGMHFGELPFLDDNTRSATVEVVERSELFEIKYADLTKTLEADDKMSSDFYTSLAYFLAARLRQVTTDLSFAREQNLRHF